MSGAQVTGGPPRGFGAVVATSDGEGRFDLGPLPAGEVRLRATKAGLGKVYAVRTLAPGDAVPWDPVLGVQASLRGRVQAPEGAPADLRWTVQAYRGGIPDAPEPFTGRAHAGPDGAFELTQVPAGPLSLTLYVQGSPIPVLHLARVEAEEGEVVLRPELDRLPTVRVVGRLVDAEGRPHVTADLRVINAELGGLSSLIHPDRTSGRFAFAPLPAGEWTLRIDPLRPGWGLVLRHHRIPTQGTWDLGDVVVGPGGRIEIGLLRPESSQGSVAVEVSHLDGHGIHRLELSGNSTLSPPLEPGNYRVSVPGLPAVAAVDVAVSAGGLYTVELLQDP